MAQILNLAWSTISEPQEIRARQPGTAGGNEHHASLSQWHQRSGYHWVADCALGRVDTP